MFFRDGEIDNEFVAKQRIDRGRPKLELGLVEFLQKRLHRIASTVHTPLSPLEFITG